MHHVIRGLVLYVDVDGSEADGMALQRRLSPLCRDWLLPALEQTMDGCAPPDGHVCIDRLCIDAGALSLESLERALPEAVAKELTKLLRERIPAIRPVLAWQKTLSAFVHFLQTGTIPWSFRLPQGHSLEQAFLACWQDATAQDMASSSDKAVLMQALTEQHVRRRLVLQLSPTFQDVLLAYLSPAARDAVAALMASLNHADIPTTAGRRLAKQLRAAAWAQLAVGQACNVDDLVQEAWSEAIQIWPSLAKAVEQRWPKAAAAILLNQQIELNRSVTVQATQVQQSLAVRNAGSTASGMKQSRQQAPFAKPLPDQTSNLLKTKDKQHPNAEEGLYVDNAGLVLLHPFLPRCLEALMMVDGTQMLRPEHAVRLLHFLATGQDAAPEHALALPKILCGMPLLDPTDPGEELSESERQEAQALLEAVVRHWDALRNTSVDGLRGTFLARVGKMSMRNGDWLLQVEAQSWDILLEQLPWSMSMVRLPWMEWTLWTEWR